MVRRPGFVLAILGGLAMGGTLARAADTVPRDDEAVSKVVAQALEATKAEDWQKYATLMHPEALRDFKEVLVPALEAAAAAPDEGALVLRFFGNIKDAKKLLALPPDKFFAQFMQGVSTQIPQFRKALTGTEFKVIGTVYEMDGMAHVLYRASVKVDEIDVSQVDVISLKRDGQSWGMLMKAEFKAMAQQLRRILKK